MIKKILLTVLSVGFGLCLSRVKIITSTQGPLNSVKSLPVRVQVRVRVRIRVRVRLQ